MKVDIITPGSAMSLELDSFGVGRLLQTAVELAGDNANRVREEAAHQFRNKALAFTIEGSTKEDEEPPKNERCGGRGFLIMKCSGCGKIRAFCSKTTITHSRCECGAHTIVSNLKRATAICSECGQRSTYYTNLTAPTHTTECIRCSSPIRIKLDKDGLEYITETGGKA